MLPFDDDNAPDVLTLNDWALDNAPELLNVVRFISDLSVVNKLLFDEWTRQGQPSINL